MNAIENGQPHPRDDNWLPKCFFENRQNFPPEQLLPYAGKHIALSWDGTRIVASADELAELFKRLDEAGIPSNRTVHSYVDEAYAQIGFGAEFISEWEITDESRQLDNGKIAAP